MNFLRNAAGAVLLVGLILIGFSVFGAVNAQTARCGGYVDVLSDLATAYHERIVWIGQRAPEGQMVITAAADGTTWTALLVTGEVACLLSAGTGWAASEARGDI